MCDNSEFDSSLVEGTSVDSTPRPLSISRESTLPTTDDGAKDNEATSNQRFCFIVGGTPAELKSKNHMIKVRKKAMDSYLRGSQKRRRGSYTPSNRSSTITEAESPPSSVVYELGEQEFDERRTNNKIAQRNYLTNLKIRFEDLERSKLSETSKNKDIVASNEPFPESSVGNRETVWPDDSRSSVGQNRPCNILQIENLPLDVSKDELKSILLRQIGYKRIYFRTKQNGSTCFVDFDDVQSATEALQHIQGYRLLNGTKKSIRLSYSQNPLGVRSGHTAGNPPIVPLETQSEGGHKIIDCVCGVQNEERYIFQCEKCGKWQHVQCYHDLMLSNGEIHECFNCSIKQWEERIKDDIYQPDEREIAWVTADTPDAFRSESNMAKIRMKAMNHYLDHQKQQEHRPGEDGESFSGQSSPKIGSQNLKPGLFSVSSTWSNYQHPSSETAIAPLSVPLKREPSGLLQGPVSNHSVLEAHDTDIKLELLSPQLKLEDETDKENIMIACPCGCAVQEILQSHMLPELRAMLEKDWNLVQGQLPDEWKWDTEYRDGCWTCTPLEPNEPKNYPLAVAGVPVVLPVEYQWPPMGGVNPPPDPRPSTPIDCRVEIPLDIVRDMFLTFEGSLGFYVLINGLLQITVSEDFDTSWASSHLPHKYGGLKVCYIPQTIEPTMRPSATQIAEKYPSTSSSTSSAINNRWSGRSLHNSWSESLKLNDFVEARPKPKSRKEKYSGRIGLKVVKDGDPYLVMSTHVITEAILAKSHLESIFGSTRNHFEKLNSDWNEHVEMWAGNEKIGTIGKTFDIGVENYPNGFNHDVILVKATALASTRDITSPILNMGWLNRDSWNSLRQQTSAVKILAPTENHRAVKSLKCSRLSEILVVGEGIFLNQTAALSSKKNLKDHDPSTWRDLVSRAVLYRVFPDFDPPNGYSGIALYADGTREDGTEGPGVVGFQSFVQRSGHVQNFEMEGVPLEQRLKLGRVAFYGAFEVPAELKEYAIV